MCSVRSTPVIDEVSKGNTVFLYTIKIGKIVINFTESEWVYRW